jgi:serine/threonine-protein kinase
MPVRGDTGRFRAEARYAALVCHPGVVPVYDYGPVGPVGAPFLVMELVDGPSLAEVAACGPLEPAWVLDVAGQVAAGLAAAHAQGLVHRDIKPANLLLAPGGTVKITDFGIASAGAAASPLDDLEPGQMPSAPMPQISRCTT